MIFSGTLYFVAISLTRALILSFELLESAVFVACDAILLTRAFVFENGVAVVVPVFMNGDSVGKFVLFNSIACSMVCCNNCLKSICCVFVENVDPLFCDGVAADKG